MAFWLNNPLAAGFATSVVGSLIAMLISGGFLLLWQRYRESRREGRVCKRVSKSKMYRTLAIIGVVAALPAYYLGIWLASGVSSEGGGELLEVGVVLRDCKNCPTMIVVPSGSFSMGSHIGEAGRYNNEGPIHPVTLSEAFGIGVYEVTRGQFRHFVEDSQHDAGQACWTYERRVWRERDGRNWRFPGISTNRPTSRSLRKLE